MASNLSLAPASPPTDRSKEPTPIRFLMLSDTHNSAFPPPNDLPHVDVVLHCGDLTMIGGLTNYRVAIENLSACPAELVLVIPGNHDVSLDPVWWQENLDEEDDDDPEEPTKAHSLFTEAAVRSGIRLLGEGVSTFTLRDGRSFSIFTSPYTPAFNGYAFAYPTVEDRFGSDVIPKNVDIVMTHGPPRLGTNDYRLDLNATGIHCGCPKLWTAIRRARPRLHCFGHIHEGYGMQKVCWDGDQFQLGDEVIESDGAVVVGHGNDETLLLNAAIMNHSKDRDNSPWVIDLAATQ